MPQVSNYNQMSRPGYGGGDPSNPVDIHIEAYQGDIDGSFRVESLFRGSGLTSFRSVANNTNTWRGNRIGSVTVSGRKVGDTLTPQRIANDKYTIQVDITSYIRTAFDWQDDWTSPDFQSEYSAEHGSAHAKAFDQAHIIALIHAAAAAAPPAHLLADPTTGKGGFYAGIKTVMTGYAAPVATALLTAAEVRADLIVKAHKDVLAEFVRRDLGASLTEFITLMGPTEFNNLLDHKKLMSVDFQGGSGDNNFAMRRVGYLNGGRVIETPRFPQGVIPAHILGPSFNVTAEDAKGKIVIFLPSKALVTVEAKEMTVRMWEDNPNFQTVMDSYCMYTVGTKRADVVACLYTD
jgi:hypothetical protein